MSGYTTFKTPVLLDVMTIKKPAKRRVFSVGLPDNATAVQAELSQPKYCNNAALIFALPQLCF